VQVQRKVIGGSFAPPLSDAKLAEYEALIPSDNRRVAEYMTQLVAMLRKFRETPDSTLAGAPHPVRGVVVPLEETEIERIWDVVPYEQECDVIGQAFEALPTGDVRNAAFHLLWFAYELAKDREPVTADKL
jgi:hypothetical protein